MEDAEPIWSQESPMTSAQLMAKDGYLLLELTTARANIDFIVSRGDAAELLDALADWLAAQ